MSAAMGLATVQAGDAHDAATSDREAAADQVLQVAVDEALNSVRVGAVGWAEYRLERARLSAARILGPGGDAT